MTGGWPVGGYEGRRKIAVFGAVILFLLSPWAFSCGGGGVGVEPTPTVTGGGEFPFATVGFVPSGFTLRERTVDRVIPGLPLPGRGQQTWVWQQDKSVWFALSRCGGSEGPD